MEATEQDIKTLFSKECGEIAGALAAAQLEIIGADKDSDNPAFGKVRKYASLASVWNSCHAPLNKQGICIVQSPQIIDGQQALVTLLVHKSGQWFRGEYKIKPTKDDPQGIGSAITYARRYSLAAMTGVAPKDDDDDGNAASEQGHAQQTRAQPKADEQPLGEDVAKKVYEWFAAVGVSRAMIDGKLGAKVAEGTSSHFQTLKRWQEEITKDRRNIARIFGGTIAAGGNGNGAKEQGDRPANPGG